MNSSEFEKLFDLPRPVEENFMWNGTGRMDTFYCGFKLRSMPDGTWNLLVLSGNWREGGEKQLEHATKEECIELWKEWGGWSFSTRHQVVNRTPTSIHKNRKFRHARRG